MQIDTELVETILTQARSASRLAGGITDASNRAIVIDELTSSINEVVRMLAELLGEPHLIAAPVPSARPSYDDDGPTEIHERPARWSDVGTKLIAAVSMAQLVESGER